jgi:hypothetical protein
VSFFAQNLWGYVVWSAAQCSKMQRRYEYAKEASVFATNPSNSPLPFLVTLNNCGQTKVTDLDVHVIVEKQVTKFEISMDNLSIVEVNAANQNLFHVVSNLRFCESLSSFVQLHQGLFENCRIIQQYQGDKST